MARAPYNDMTVARAGALLARALRHQAYLAHEDGHDRLGKVLDDQADEVERCAVCAIAERQRRDATRDTNASRR